jgi:pimeloyl-ACP methyl ester carboxylesterase
MSPLMSILKKKFRTVSLDLPGFGSSDAPGKEWGTKDYAGIVRDFLLQKTNHPVIFFGHSFGGALGIYLAASYPELISSLILAAPSFRRIPKQKNAVTAIFKNLPLPETVKLFIRKIFYKVFFPRSDILAYPHMEETYRKIITEDLTPFLSRIDKQTLILWGDRDRDTPPDNAMLLKNSVNKSKLVMFPGYTHNFPLTHPDNVVREIERFL